MRRSFGGRWERWERRVKLDPVAITTKQRKHARAVGDEILGQRAGNSVRWGYDTRSDCRMGRGWEEGADGGRRGWRRRINETSRHYWFISRFPARPPANNQIGYCWIGTNAPRLRGSRSRMGSHRGCGAAPPRAIAIIHSSSTDLYLPT